MAEDLARWMARGPVTRCGRSEEEASVTGESPDRSEQQKSSGETTRGRERDPRLAVFQAGPPSGKGGADTDTDAGADTDDADTDTLTGADTSAGTGTDADAGADTDTDADTGTDAGADRGDARLPTAVTAWVTTSDVAESASDDREPGAGTAEGPAADEPAADSSADDRSAGDGPAGDGPAGDRSADDRSADGGSLPSGAPSGDSGADAGSGPDEAPSSGGGKQVDQPTAVFRAVPSPVGENTPSDGTGGKASVSADGSAGERSATDQPTAAFRTGNPRDTGRPTSDQPTTAIRAVRPQAGKPGEAAGAGRTSRFVPLRSDGPASRAPRSGDGRADGGGESSRAGGRPDNAARTSGRPDTARTGAVTGSADRVGLGPAPRGVSAPSEAPSEALLVPEAERTKQQPLPPAPSVGQPAPLDLLAQLTNTPPPPETPLRIAVRRIRIWTPLVVLLVLVFGVVQALRPLPEPALDLTASERYSFDGSKPSIPWPSEGQAVLEVEGLGNLGSYGEQKPVPIASVAKVMTAYVVLRDHPVKKGSKGATIEIDQQAADDAKLGSDGESVVEVATGDSISQKEAIEAIMIASANNVARLLARWDAGSEEAFVRKMNDAAKDLGMTNTTYTDPSGLREQTVSTAADQVKLGRKAMDDPLFREIVKMPRYTDSKGVSHANWNRLVPLDGVVGIKTGTTTKAGGNLLFAAEQEIGGTTQLIIGAVLGQYKPSIIDTVLAESGKLIDAAQDVLMARTVVKKGDVVGQVDDGLGGTTPVVATRDVTAVGWPGLTVDLRLSDDGKAIPREAAAGTEVGTLTVGSGPGQVKVPVELQKDLVEPSFGTRLTRIA
jgi:D-alanyl-D-alanine carboxypeptidase